MKANYNNNYYRELADYIKTNEPSKDKLNSFKAKLSGKYKLKRIPKDIDIILNLGEKELGDVKKYLVTKPVRSLSGVAVVAMMAKPRKCPHGKCIFCPGGPKSRFGSVPQSYTGREPSTMRSIRNNYDSYLIMMNRLEQYICAGHMPEKVELIIQGGTFPAYPKKYQEEYVMYAFKAMNDFSRMFFSKGKLELKKFKSFFELPGDLYDIKRQERVRKKLLSLKKNRTTLEAEQRKNENAAVRCVGLTIETNPENGGLKEGNEMLKLGCTRVELGVQTVFDDILKKCGRGHCIEETINSIKTLRDLGFKLNFHMMLGLPGVSRKMDNFALRILFIDERFQPDMLKLYPCMVMAGTKLYDMWKKGKYRPLTTAKAAEMIAEFKRDIPSHCRIMRVQRDIPTHMTAAGVDRTNLRQYVNEICRKRRIKCRCIRCREIGRKSIGRARGKYLLKKPNYTVREYNASGGNEFFIEALSDGALLGFCRLRFPSQCIRPEIEEDSAIIRELHVFGSAVGIGKKGLGTEVQHRGIGKRLMKIAEDISRNYLKRKIIAISGVGARGYYRKIGYKKEGAYMVKRVSYP